MAKLNSLPIQTLLAKDFLRIERLRTDYHYLSTVPHRHDHYELLWITSGKGFHYINFKPYPFIQNRIYLLQEGQMHLIPEFERDGWIILISEHLIHQFFATHPTEEGSGLFDPFGTDPFLDLDNHTSLFFDNCLSLLQAELSNDYPSKNVLFHLLSIMLLKINGQHLKTYGKEPLIQREKEVLLKLRRLINQHYRKEHNTDFYVQKLGINVKTVNHICQKLVQRSVHDLIKDKLLTEAKMLLLTTGTNMKEIAFELGFSDPAYFGRFFKKLTKLTPANYRSDNS